MWFVRTYLRPTGVSGLKLLVYEALLLVYESVYMWLVRTYRCKHMSSSRKHELLVSKALNY